MRGAAELWVRYIFVIRLKVFVNDTNTIDVQQWRSGTKLYLQFTVVKKQSMEVCDSCGVNCLKSNYSTQT